MQEKDEDRLYKIISVVSMLFMLAFCATQVPKAIVREAEIKESRSQTRCLKHGDFQDGDAFCRAWDKQMGNKE